MRILLSGYYGFGNAGDEAVLAGTLTALRRRLPSVEVTVLSARPEATAAEYGVRTAQRWHWPTIWRELGRSDLVLQGGGGLVQDSSSRLSPLYYLGILLAARLRRKPFAVYAQGIGPLSGGPVRWLTGRLLQGAAAIAVRDEASAALLAQIGVPRGVEVTADAAALLDPAPAGQVAPWLPRPRTGPLIGLALREAPGCERLVEGAIAAGRRLRELTGGQCLAMAFHARDDGPLARRAAEEAGGTVVGGSENGTDTFSDVGKCVCPIFRPTPGEWLGVVASLDFLVAMRLHAAIFAAATGVPFVALSYDPKVAAFAHRLGAPCVEIDADPHEIVEVTERAWEARGCEADRRRAAAARLRQEAERNIDLVADLARRIGEQTNTP